MMLKKQDQVMTMLESKLEELEKNLIFKQDNLTRLKSGVAQSEHEIQQFVVLIRDYKLAIEKINDQSKSS